MTSLSNGGIRRAMKRGGLAIVPFLEAQLQPSSYDLVLHPKVLLRVPGRWQTILPDEQGRLWLPAHAFALASTYERVEIPPWLKAQVMGCSTEGRKGLQIECAGLVDPGFRGQLTLELTNLWPEHIWIRAYERIAQIVFDILDQPADPPYEGRYQDQDGPIPARERA